MTIAAKARAGKSWLRSVPLLVLVAFASRSLAQDIYFIPAGFPAVCAQNLGTGVDQCPDGAGTSEDKFCEADLPMLKAFVRQERLSVCGGATATSAGSYDQILLIDMRGASETLRQLLGPVPQNELVVSHGGLFRDRQQVDRTVHVAFEAPADQDSSPGTAQHSSSDPNRSNADDAPELRIPETSEISETRGTPSDELTDESAGSESGTRTSGGAARVQRRVNVEFDRNFLAFRSNFARGLSRWMMTGRAAELAMDPQVRNVHNDLLRDPNCENCSRELGFFEDGDPLPFDVILHYQQEPVRRVQSFEILWD